MQLHRRRDTGKLGMSGFCNVLTEIQIDIGLRYKVRPMLGACKEILMSTGSVHVRVTLRDF